jgi:hypothetical protein
MNKQEKNEVLSMDSVAYYSGLNGLEVKRIDYGINDYIVCVSGAWNGKYKVHRVKINYNSNNPTIKLYGYTIPLNEMLKI